MKLFDSHCHVNFKAFNADSTDVIRRSLDSGVGLNVVGTKLKTSQEAVELAKQYDGVFATVGLHPVHLFEQKIAEEGESFTTKPEEFDYESFKRLAQEEKVIGIGEMGIDYYHLPEGMSTEEALEVQKKALLDGIKLAGEVNKPVVFHVRPSKDSYNAYDDLLKILSDVNGQMSSVDGVVHCYGGTLEQAKKFVDLGLYIGITGIVTFKNATELLEVVKEIPLEKLLLETDAPFLSPEPYRGKRNEPSYVNYIAEKIAEIKGEEFEQVAEQTTENARKLFSI